MEKPEKSRSPDRQAPGRAEDAYNRLAGYRFARRYAAGKAVADVDPQRIGYGAHVLAGVVGSVTCLADASETQKLRQRLDDIESSRIYRLLGVYRRLRLGLGSLVSSRRSR